MKLSLPLVALACTLGSTTAFVPAASHRLNTALTQQQPRTVTREVSVWDWHSLIHYIWLDNAAAGLIQI